MNTLNLLTHHGEERGREETRKLLRLLTNADFRLLWQRKREAYLQAPFQWQYRMLCLCDNGGEINLGWVNGGMVSIPTTGHGVATNAETIHYRLITALECAKGMDFPDEVILNTIDWNLRCESLTDDDYKLL
jgi:hypothetical protein